MAMLYYYYSRALAVVVVVVVRPEEREIGRYQPEKSLFRPARASSPPRKTSKIGFFKNPSFLMLPWLSAFID
jgi:hypothetical protein